MPETIYCASGTCFRRVKENYSFCDKCAEELKGGMNAGNDPVNSPNHYTAGGVEVIDFIEAKDFNYRLGNAIKYISRAGKKDPKTYVQDLQKAIWYIEREIKKHDR